MSEQPEYASIPGTNVRVRLQMCPQAETTGQDAATELRRLHAENEALRAERDLWIEKTEWVQDTAQPNELGMHRADGLRQRIERLQAENAALRAQRDELLAALKKISLTEYHIETPPSESLEEQMRRMARAAIDAATKGDTP